MFERMKFTGHERDLASGLDYMHARYYSSYVNRFLSVDPGKDNDTNTPQSWNLYGYARNNPLKLVDPNGKVTLVFTVGLGNGLFEKGGHSAVLVLHPSGSYNGVSLDGNNQFQSGLAGFIRGYNAEGRTVFMTVLDTTPEQESKMLSFLGSNPEGGVDRQAFGADAMLRENCAQAVGNTLEAGGVFAPGANPSQVLGGALSLPAQLFQEVQALPTSLGTIVFEPDPSPERDRFLEFVLDVGPPAPAR